MFVAVCIKHQKLKQKLWFLSLTCSFIFGNCQFQKYERFIMHFTCFKWKWTASIKLNFESTNWNVFWNERFETKFAKSELAKLIILKCHAASVLRKHLLLPRLSTSISFVSWNEKIILLYINCCVKLLIFFLLFSRECSSLESPVFTYFIMSCK